MKKIKFWALTENSEVPNFVNPPVPAKKEVPKWYSEMKRYYFGDKLEVADNGAVNIGVKACMPFYDALTSGYIVKLHCDVLVEINDSKTYVKWTSKVSPVSPRAEGLFIGMPEPAGFKNLNLAWELFFPFLLPDGYSALVTQPLNRTELVTFATSGIVDADSINGGGGIPFFIKKDFSGIIPAGTPILQIIPFKRDPWNMEILEKPPITSIKWTPHNKISGWYKMNVWKRKSFD
jgi:hypothetical protein